MRETIRGVAFDVVIESHRSICASQ